MKKQVNVLNNMSHRELLLNVYLSQALMFLIASVLGFFLFDHWSEFFRFFRLNLVEIFIVGGGLALAVVITGVGLAVFLQPRLLLDEGGVNERIFSNLSIPHMFVLCFIVALSEEFLFRAVLQTACGLIVASVIFALIHFRYLKSPVLFLFVLFISFLLGFIFHWTENILVTVFAHFLIDLLFGLFIKIKSIKVKL